MATAKSNAKSLTLKFELERETKNKIRFQEVATEDGNPVVGTLYIDKEFTEVLGNPETLTVRITA